MHQYKIMRILCLIAASCAFDINAFAFSQSKVEHVMYPYESRRRLDAVDVASFQHSTRSSEASTANKSLMLSVNLEALKDKYDSPKRHSVGKPATAFRKILVAIVLAATIGSPAFADEYGVEKEAPTLFTGETVEVCTIDAISEPRCLELSKF